MPRATYGPTVKTRTLHVLKILLQYANQEFEDHSTHAITCSWHDLYTDIPKLVVQTNLRTLHRICQCTWTSDKLSKTEIREALRCLQNFLEILEDYRVHRRGTETWHFGLNLWCRETEQCLQIASAQWDQQREQRLYRHNSQPRTATNSDHLPSVAPAISPLLNGLLPGAPFQALPLPHFFVSRPEPLADLKHHLLNRTPEQPGTLVVSAIYGLGGIGKTVLASALAHDIDVRSRFCHGVLWATLGQEPDVLSFLSHWIQGLGDHSYKPTTANAASAHLRTLLHDKRMLLVVDDVWNPAHAEPFRVGGTDCCVLVTTREARIRGALRYDLDVMTPEQAIALFQQAIQDELSETDIEEALTLSAKVEYLPLALELAAAQIEDGASWTEILEALQQEIAQLEILDIQGFGFDSQDARQRNLSLLASFNLSLKRLMPGQLSCFAWLGVVPEDVTITESMAATLWATTPQQARTMLRFLKSRALLLSGGRQLDKKLGYRLHDLMHAVACRLLVSDPIPSQPNQLPGLGLELKMAHAQFLQRYRSQLQNKLWHTVGNDGYIHAHLTWHLEQAGLTDEVHQLLQETTISGHNGWSEACKALGQTAGFVADIARGWRLAEGLFEEDVARSLGLQFRYALIKTSLNSLVENCPPELAEALVKQGKWQPAQGLTHAKQSPDLNYKWLILDKVIPLLPDSLLPEAQNIANNLTDRDFRVLTFAQLACRVPELQSEAIASARALTNNFLRSLALGKLTSVQPQLWTDILESIRSAKNERDRAGIIKEWGGKFPNHLLDEVVAIASSLSDTYDRTLALAVLASRKPEVKSYVLKNLLQPTREFKEMYGRAYNLGLLASLQSDLWPEVIETIQGIEHEISKAAILDNLAKRLPEAYLMDVINIARQIEREPRRARALGSLTLRQPNLWQEAVAATQVIRDADWQITALAEMANGHQPLWTVVEQVSQTFDDAYDQAIATIHGARGKPDCWDKATSAVLKIKDVYDKAQAFRLMAEYGHPHWQETLTAVQSVHHFLTKAELMYRLAEVMPEAWDWVMAATEDLRFESQKTVLLYRYITQMPDTLLPQALSVTQSFTDPFEQLLALSALSIRVTEIQPEVSTKFETLEFTEDQSVHKLLIAGAIAMTGMKPWSEVFELIASTSEDGAKFDVVDGLAPMLPEEHLEQALTISLQIQTDCYRAYALEGLLPRTDLTKVDHNVWCAILHTVAFLCRADLLKLVPVFCDGIVARGGHKALEEVAYAIRDVCQQW